MTINGRYYPATITTRNGKTWTRSPLGLGWPYEVDGCVRYVSGDREAIYAGEDKVYKTDILPGNLRRPGRMISHLSDESMRELDRRGA